MANQVELKRAVEELEKATGLQMQVKADTPEEVETAYTQIRQLLGAYKEKYNKNYFLQNLMLGNLQETEVEDHAKKLHISTEDARVLFLIETKSPVDDFLIELLKNLFPSQNKNYVVKMTQHRLVLLLPSKCIEEEVYDESMATAHMMIDTVSAEAMSSIRVSFGRRIKNLSKLAEAYAEVGLAMKIGTTFYSEQLIIPYDQLGIGRLIYQLPADLCYQFLHEVFKQKDTVGLEEEMQMTVSKFFQNNLNIAETSRQLHMHRNTLIYRIEQLEKQTGLDIRVFEDALTFRIAMMVLNYVNAPMDQKAPMDK